MDQAEFEAQWKLKCAEVGSLKGFLAKMRPVSNSVYLSLYS